MAAGERGRARDPGRVHEAGAVDVAGGEFAERLARRGGGIGERRRHARRRAARARDDREALEHEVRIALAQDARGEGAVTVEATAGDGRHQLGRARRVDLSERQVGPAPPRGRELRLIAKSGVAQDHRRPRLRRQRRRLVGLAPPARHDRERPRAPSIDEDRRDRHVAATQARRRLAVLRAEPAVTRPQPARRPIATSEHDFHCIAAPETLYSLP